MYFWEWFCHCGQTLSPTKKDKDDNDDFRETPNPSYEGGIFIFIFASFPSFLQIGSSWNPTLALSLCNHSPYPTLKRKKQLQNCKIKKQTIEKGRRERCGRLGLGLGFCCRRLRKRWWKYVFILKYWDFRALFGLCVFFFFRDKRDNFQKLIIMP